MIIHPEVIVTPDFPTVKFKQAEEQVNLDTELPRILRNQGWGVGIYFNVQFVNDGKLLSSALYVVTEEKEVYQTGGDEYNPRSSSVTYHKAERIGPVSIFGGKKESGSKIVWNPGKQVHQLKVGNDVIFESKDKSEVEKFEAA